MTTPPSPTRDHRDVTRALEIAHEMQKNSKLTGVQWTLRPLRRLVQILTDIDARTGTRDPSKQSKRSAKKAGRK